MLLLPRAHQQGPSKPTSGPLIQELSTSPAAAPELPRPQYSLHTTDTTCSVTVHLPLVDSVGELDLDASEVDLSLHAPEKYSLVVKFPRPVDDTCVSAEFNKQHHVLVVKLAFK